MNGFVIPFRVTLWFKQNDVKPFVFLYPNQVVCQLISNQIMVKLVRAFSPNQNMIKCVIGMITQSTTNRCCSTFVGLKQHMNKILEFSNFQGC